MPKVNVAPTAKARKIAIAAPTRRRRRRLRGAALVAACYAASFSETLWLPLPEDWP